MVHIGGAGSALTRAIFSALSITPFAVPTLTHIRGRIVLDCPQRLRSVMEAGALCPSSKEAVNYEVFRP